MRSSATFVSIFISQEANDTKREEIRLFTEGIDHLETEMKHEEYVSDNLKKVVEYREKAQQELVAEVCLICSVTGYCVV